ncbi:MAG TPA: DEAD/DEAH box helicase [Saprospirales bacterium]|jgi:superfamily II DNA or RNA helicase|nr:DEAD/DEAH box helicase family protein [Saprospiraceae bacterium]HAV29050.1 DEAD/DEAH box helicase [Saprospirales bacterium]MDA9873898.1 DEAD/DEAH box helicase family protein [Saprospiraceae bacterium]MDB4163501.1 DEAD/DEAH box helicase family protein [Saprospiraceae bacterium]MDB4824673.1 DEAD/DEAH box helicase family protein [Saprospiraceae bacterium]|tara:strand:+ start:6141 stop:7700 length:1560 start_codon:yes stop_codon:yes gene_type:complete
MADISDTVQDKRSDKELYSYQKGAIDRIFLAFEEAPDDYHLLYQLPTGGGKTVIFSEIVRQYLKTHKKKVLVMTHRVELCKQTSNMLTEFGVKNKVVNSTANLDDQNDYMCFVAMVETLNNRLLDDVLDVSGVGLVIIDEAHYNSFTKIFKFFSKSFLLGVTATPLSSNTKLPMNENYNELIAGETIQALIENEFLAKANMYAYNVGLTSLTIGANGDYTVKSSEDLYTSTGMLTKLMQAYDQRSKGKKTLIFNNGINTSLYVYESFKQAGLPIMHLDNTASKKQRAYILDWFKHTPGAILSSVSILTTGFDEPTVESIILNRATKSLTLYYQMIGRGSRILKDKSEFDVIDLGNNFLRFGPWGADLDWQKIFRNPDTFLDNLLEDEEIESFFKYEMPEKLRAKFSKSKDVYFDVKAAYVDVLRSDAQSKEVLARSMDQHTHIIIENSEDVYDALELVDLLNEDINFRLKQYTKCISKSTYSFLSWLKTDYRTRLKSHLRKNFNTLFEDVHGHPPVEEE